MWISEEKWVAINKRIDDLEKKIPGEPSAESLTFTVYDEKIKKSRMAAGLYYWLQSVPRQEISVKDAIRKIMTHLGIELTYIAGKPADVVLQKVKRSD